DSDDWHSSGEKWLDPPLDDGCRGGDKCRNYHAYEHQSTDLQGYRREGYSASIRRRNGYTTGFPLADTIPHANTRSDADTIPLGQPKSVLITINRGSRYLHIVSCSAISSTRSG